MDPCGAHSTDCPCEEALYSHGKGCAGHAQICESAFDLDGDQPNPLQCEGPEKHKWTLNRDYTYSPPPPPNP
ncbi:hypothetical protein GCM10027456_13720 [Kineosporia babensis]